MPLEQITDRATHDAAVDLAADTNARPNPHPTPIVMYITSDASARSSSTLTAQVTKLSDEFAGRVRFFEMPMTKDTTPMIKFGPWNCPLFIFMRGTFCRTEYGRIGVEGIRSICEEMVRMGESA